MGSVGPAPNPDTKAELAANGRSLLSVPLAARQANRSYSRRRLRDEFSGRGFESAASTISIVRPTEGLSQAAVSRSTSHPGKTRTAGWHCRALARTFARSTPNLTRSFSIAEIVD